MRRWLSIVPLFLASHINAHSPNPMGVSELDWQTSSIQRVFSAGYAFNLLDLNWFRSEPAHTYESARGEKCVSASVIAADLDDSRYFDVTGDYRIYVWFDSARSPAESETILAADAEVRPFHGVLKKSLQSQVTREGLSRWEVTIPAARFANRGFGNSDIAILSRTSEAFGLCDLTVEPSGQHHADISDSEATGRLHLKILDKDTRSPVPARVGIYDQRERMILPGKDAVETDVFGHSARIIRNRSSEFSAAVNEYAFYADDTYSVDLAAGAYKVVVSKGFEYRVARKTLEITPGNQHNIVLELERFADSRKSGWLSGDAHVHAVRSSDQKRRSLLLQAMSEDVHVTNVLSMGNIRKLYFEQTDFAAVVHNEYSLVAGQEDPRTNWLGHAIHLNVDGTVRFPEDYLDYPKVFRAMDNQGSVSGVAHVWSPDMSARIGGLLLAFEGLLETVEIMQAGQLGTEFWFDLLNLGFAVVPLAGSDYPYLGQIGSVRNYVMTDGRHDAESWFEALEQGKTYVTNGPLVEFSVNGSGMGTSVVVSGHDELGVEFSVKLNPDIGQLTRLVLIGNGVEIEVIKTSGSEYMQQGLKTRLERSGWLLLQVEGAAADGRKLWAITAPVYVKVDGNARTWQKDKVAHIADKYISVIRKALKEDLHSASRLEHWDTAEEWARNGEHHSGTYVKQLHKTLDALHKIKLKAAEVES